MKSFADGGFKRIQDWPLYSPDLYPIEHCWPLLKEHTYRLHPDVETWKGSDETIQDRMEDALVCAWDQMRTEMAHNLVNSLKERIEATLRSFSFSSFYMLFISHELVSDLLSVGPSLCWLVVPPFSCYTTSSHSYLASRSWHLDPAPWRFAMTPRESPGDISPARSAITIDKFDE
jgi:hypothetical protein